MTVTTPASGPLTPRSPLSAPARQRVRVVTDSTCGLPDGMAEQLGVVVVPLQLHVGERIGYEGVDLGATEVAAAMDAKVAVSTQPPTAQAFTDAFTRASGIGRSPHPLDVVSVHLSNALSDTGLHARQGSVPLDYAGVGVEVVDARTTAMGLGFAVVAAARAAAEGHSARMVARAAEDAARRTDALFYVDTLEHLRRGGRIGLAQAIVGQLLGMKPLLHVADGVVAPLEKVRGSEKALARLQDLVVERCGSGEVQLAVQHLAAPQRASDLAGALHRRLGRRVTSMSVTDVSAVVGAHVGPGVVGAIVHRMP